VLGDEAQPPQVGYGSLSICEAVGEVLTEMGEDASAAALCEALRVRLFVE
jgi:hypothetical protein